ncbi:FecCD family ABC transporter permease [Desertibacillus haloalkaliphilus]|uniref:FecCD family ABC transporter permease n=1 Tax=Desertibacillus haloalkaliphilus TaxID=1328930 RepID=UPI001C263414|nr:iron ABC transporter permease [Desertibacillus haloalkaliphilus]MBU8908915.1 iron ABC transporter permease [Desertibacillus haloalkaliphilus]
MILKSTPAKVSGLIVGIVIFLLFICLSIVYGYTNTSWKTAIEAYTNFNGSNEHLIIQTTRMPRALIAATVGASLGVAGALMQALTNNPLADPKIFGIDAGASFFIVSAVTFFSITSLGSFVWIAFAGAALAGAAVYFIGSLGREGLTPMKFTLAGAAIWALFSSLTQGMLVLNEKALEEVLFWLAGSVQGRNLEYLQSVLPYLLVAWVGSLVIARHINLLSMGEDVAKGLGQRTGFIKLISAIIIIILAGGSVAIAGPIGFVGIMVPHIARFFVGIDHRWLIPYCAIIGGCLLLVADISARYVIMPQEVPVGVMTAIIGTPFFIYIARKGVSKS